jgi:hypothetical protein
VSSADIRSRTELTASSSPVDIASIPWRFSAVKYDLLDQFFLPVLSAAQQANDVAGVRAGGSESALHAAALLAGDLMRDSNFSVVRPGPANASNICTIDFKENSFQVETSITAKDTHKAGFFRVKVSGAIRGDKFLVSDSVTRNSLFSFTRFEANKPNFFSVEFPFITLESRQNPSKFAAENSKMMREVIDLVLGIPVGEETITVRIHKQSQTLSAEVKNPINNKSVMSVPMASLSDINLLVETIAQHLSANAADLVSVSPPSSEPVPDPAKADAQ